MESNRILDCAPRVIESRPINGGRHRVGEHTGGLLNAQWA
jgi:hypothetical protein